MKIIPAASEVTASVFPFLSVSNSKINAGKLLRVIRRFFPVSIAGFFVYFPDVSVA